MDFQDFIFRIFLSIPTYYTMNRIELVDFGKIFSKILQRIKYRSRIYIVNDIIS